MGSIALIIGALAAVSEAAKDTASQPVKGAYAGFKSLIQKRLADKKKLEGEMTLAKYEEKCEVWEEPLKDALVEKQAHNADEIIKAAESLKKFPEEMPEGREAVSKYLLNIHNSDAGVGGGLSHRSRRSPFWKQCTFNYQLSGL